MTKKRIHLTLNWFLLISLILASCSGIPTPAPVIPTPTFLRQSAPPAIIESDPPLESVIGHLAPITFYFNQPMNKNSVEPAFSGLPPGAYVWKDESTLLYTPAQPYPPNAKLNISIGPSVQSAVGYGITEPIELSFAVSDYLRATNILPKADSTDANVDAAIVASFNQPVVPLGADSSSLPSAFNILPSVSGRGEWINTSTYIFYPESSMQGGTEYTVSVNPDLKTVTGVGLDGGAQNAWRFVTARPRVVELGPFTDGSVALDAEIKLTFNQPMNEESVQSNFLFSGTDGPVNGTFTWNDRATEISFKPDSLLARNVGYLLNLNADAQSRGGVTLGEDYGAVLNTFPNFTVARTYTTHGVTTVYFTSPIPEGKYDNFVTVTPAVDDLSVVDYQGEWGLQIYGAFIPDTDYVIEVAGTIKDLWGQALGNPFAFNVRTPPIPPQLNLRFFGSNTLFVRPDEPVLYANAVNIKTANVTVAPLSLQDFFTLQTSLETQQAYAPINPAVIPHSFDLTPSLEREVKLNLTQQNNPLPVGLYYVAFSSPQVNENAKRVYFAASSHVNLTFKIGATEALVWAVDLPSQTPIPDAPVTIYDQDGTIVASGATDENGLWRGPINRQANAGSGKLNMPVVSENYGGGGVPGQAYAMLGAPGEESFAFAINNWSTAWGYAQIDSPNTELYFYTDRPIYRPGQTVYFRGVARQAFNGRYELPSINSVPLSLLDWNGTQILSLDLPLSPYGTFNGEYKLSDDAAPGYYTIRNESLDFYFGFQVAEYRKPEINLSADFASDEIKLGEPANASINVRYFFGAPAGDVEVTWAAYAQHDYFYLPGYQTGVFDDSWLGGSGLYFGDSIADGTGHTNPQGILSIDLPAIPARDSLQLVTLEVTATDESGFPVSARTELRVHPADFYIGLRPDRWIGTAKSAIGFDVFTADWAGNASGDKSLAAEFKQVRWEKETVANGNIKYTPVFTPVSGSNLATGPDGRARLSFVPPTAGTYLLDVRGGGASTQTLVWIGGAGTAIWPDLPNQKLQLTADKDSYIAGDISKIFIPNPFPTNSLALVAVERGILFKAEVLTLTGSGKEYVLPLTDDAAPNVYVSVTVLGQGNEFKYGRVNIPVAPDAQELNVQVTSEPTQAGPRDNLTFNVVVSDNQGQPVEGEFSLFVVDLAVLALADPNAEDILPAYYSEQPPGIQTGISLAAYGGQNVGGVGGGGGGAGEGPPVLREEFPDTAYWNPSLITNSEGRGQATMTLPDSLTTWQVDVRGLTVDTKVGQAETQIISTKPLLVRPVTPRFLVNGDHVMMAAILNNNTSNQLSVSVNLQSEGFVLDEPDKATQQVNVPANGRTRVEWWGTTGLAESADLVFTAIANGNPSLQDSTQPVWGALPILQYTSPQAFVTGGSLRGAATQQEVISLPRTFAPSSGGLEVELSPSLAGSLTSALEAMPEPNENSAEDVVSFILPNVEVYRALSNAGLNDPKLVDRVNANLNSSVSRLFYLQNTDGGWNWWGKSPLIDGVTEVKSDPYVSAYVFLGLLRAREAGATVNEEALQRASVSLRDSQPAITANTNAYGLDTIAFMQFALAHANTFNETIINQLYDARDRMSPAGVALLAFTMNKFNSADTRARDLISNLESSAILSSSSAHWESQGDSFFANRSTIYTTSTVIYALSQIDPANQIVSNAVRYLAAHRNANKLWNIGHDNAWAILALNAAMVGLGEVRADFAFNAALNGSPLTSGDVAGIQVTPITATVPLEFLSPNSPNLLTINREDGLGRLYYNATLQLNRPVEDVKPLDKGMQIERTHVDFDCRASTPGSALRSGRACPPLSSFQLDPNKLIIAQLTLTLPHDAYYVMVEDFIPAGTEILDQNLKTSQLGIDSTDVQVQFDEEDPFAEGWGWWLFNPPQIRDESILFTAEYLPAGTYVLTYTLTPLQAGEYRVLPAHAWQAFFPEVQGTSAGMVVKVKP